MISQATSSVYIKDVFIPSIVENFKQMATAPINHPEMVWVAIPLIITLLFLEFYFGRYRDEELGWNTALGNSLVLVFVGIDLLRRLFGDKFFANIKASTIIIITPYSLIALLILFAGLTMILINFFHLLPKKFAFVLASPLTVNLTSYIAVIFIYAQMPINASTMIAALAFFMIVVLAIDLIHLVEPHTSSDPRTNVEKMLKKLTN